MRVLLAGNHWTAGPGGAETVLALTADLLTADGHEVIPFALAEEDTQPTPAADLLPRRRRARTAAGEAWRGTWSQSVWRSVSRAVERFHPDVAHVHHVYEGLTLSVVDALHRRGLPVVMTLHDYRPVCPGFRLLPRGGADTGCLQAGPGRVLRDRCLEGSRWRAWGALTEAWVARWMRWYDRVALFLSPSAFLADRLEEAGWDRSRIRVAPNPVAVPVQGRAEPPDPPYVAFTGRLVAEKGVHDLLDASGLIPAGARVKLLGSGRAEAELRHRVATERLPVDLLGRGTPADAADLLRAASVATLPARWHENCPMAVLEAAASGVPVVATRMGGIPELVEDGRTGLLVEPGRPAALAAALTTLLEDPPRAADMGSAGRAKVTTRHDPATHLHELLAAYDQAAGRPPTGR